MAVVEIEKRDRVAIVTLNRPEARNAVNHEVARRDGGRRSTTSRPTMRSPW